MEEISQDTIGRCRDGDMQAFSMVVERYQKPIYSFVYRMLQRSAFPGAAEDVVQEVFLKVYRKIDTFDVERGSKFSTWLFAIARNHCVSLLRKNGHERNHADLNDGKFATIPDSRSPNPRDIAGESELREQIAMAVAELPEKVRSPFVLKHYEGLSYDEIAAVMKCSAGTVKSRVSRAKERLLLQLKDYV
jgi:RNA polymerase sigma-70 factor (ECF subfamily)